MKQLSSIRCFDGYQRQFEHQSKVLACTMRFSVYLPPQAEEHKVPVLYWLSGLTCTDENFVHKAGAQRYASEHGVAIVAPDTSPRGDDVPDDAEGAYDFGLGAGFYVNAVRTPWRQHYQMCDYINEELPALIEAELPVDASRCGIFGHSMGGHGALTIGLRNAERFRSISAFAPISSPINAPWGQKALGYYLGADQSAWQDYDACALIGRYATSRQPVLVDQGDADTFLTEQLKPELLRNAFEQAGRPLTLRMQAGYDHSYFFIATFIEQHIKFHVHNMS